MKPETVVVKYAGVEITYNEDTNRWNFELRGRERNAESLAAAKKAIDAPEPMKKASFERIKVYMFERWKADGTGVESVEVTSVADSRYGTEVWIVNAGRREKVRADAVYVATPENEALINEWKRAREEEKAASRREDGLVRRMKTVVSVLPKAEQES